MLFGSKNQPCKLIVHRFWSLQQTSQYAKYQTYTNIQDVYCVAVLQCCSSKNGCMKVWNELYIYIYIDIELFFAYGKGFLRTATLQHCNKMLSFPDFGWQFLLPFLQWWKKIKKSWQKIREPQWECCTFALERLNTHRLATDVRHLSSLRCCARCYSENEEEASSPASPLHQSPNPDETIEGENRGRMKRQMTHLRSLTDLHTPKGNFICSV